MYSDSVSHLTFGDRFDKDLRTVIGPLRSKQIHLKINKRYKYLKQIRYMFASIETY